MGVKLLGTVASYSAKRSGYINIEGREKQLRFKFEDGRCFVEGEDKVSWSENRVMREPAVGDRVYAKPWRDTAERWGFADDYEAIEGRIRGRRFAA